MGRKKMKIVKKPQKERLTCYNKRKDGISRKASQLAILCDTDVLLLTVSPKGGQDLTLGPSSNLENVIRRYGRVDPHERDKKRHESVKILCNAYKKNNDHQVDIEELLSYGASKTAHTCKISAEEMQLIESKLGKLKHLEELPMIQDTVLLTEMETELHKLLKQTNEFMMNLQMPVPRESNCQTFPLQEGIHNSMPSNFNNDSMPSSSVHQISRDTIIPSIASSSMPAQVIYEDLTNELLNILDNDVMNGPQATSWRPDNYYP